MLGEASISSRKRARVEGAEEGVSQREPKRLRICLRVVVKELSAWRIDPDRLTFFNDDLKINSGSADILRGTLTTLKPSTLENLSSMTFHGVAVKKFRFEGCAHKRAQSAAFANEISLLSKLSHYNVIKLLGFVENATENIGWIVFPWEVNGNLREFVKSQPWVIPERLSLIHDVACGVDYLHSRDPPVCHGDLKSLNILVNADNRAVITDFGSARILEGNCRAEIATGTIDVLAVQDFHNASSSSTERALVTVDGCGTFITLSGPVYTLRWAAPEVLAEDKFGVESDIWAFGWICWEIMTGDIPFEDLKRDVAIVLRVTRGDLPVIAKNEHLSQVRALCAMMTRCWAMKATDRPSAKECEREMSWMHRITPARRRDRTTGQEGDSAVALCALGHTNNANGNIREAISCFLKALNKARSTGDALVVAHAAVGLGTACTEQGNWTHATTWFNQAKEIYATMKNNPGVADAAFGLGGVYKSQNKYESAEKSYNEARTLFAHAGSQEGVADAPWGLGEVCSAQNRLKESEVYYFSARTIYDRIGNKRGVANADLGLGTVYWFCDKYDSAEPLYTEALEIYTQIEDQRGIAHAQRSLGELHRLRDKYNKAESAYSAAQEVYKRLEYQPGLAAVKLCLGAMHRMQGDVVNATSAYNEAKIIYSGLEDRKGIANAERCLGEVLRLDKQYTRSRASYYAARGLYLEIGDRRGAVNAALGLAELCSLAKEHSVADSFYAEALKGYSGIADSKGAANAFRSLALHWHSQQRYRDAARSFSAASKIFHHIGSKTDAQLRDAHIRAMIVHQTSDQQAHQGSFGNCLACLSSLRHLS